MEKTLALKAELDGAEKHFSRMGDHITEISVRTAETLITVLEKMAFYSAGIISLSITFIGYLMSKDAKILATCVMGLPLFIWLFAGWTLLIINLILSFGIRWSFAKYLSYNAAQEWTAAKIKKIQLKKELVEIGYPIISTTNENEDQIIANFEEVIKRETENRGEYAKLEKYNFQIKQYAGYASALAFVVGLVLLLIVAMASVLFLVEL